METRGDAQHQGESNAGQPDAPPPIGPTPTHTPLPNPHRDAPPTPAPVSDDEMIDPDGPPVSPATLIGNLPCCVCGYDLRGLSITGKCPECGTAVRGSILYRVDPAAEAFRPLHAPRLMAWACRFWVTAALAAATAVWLMRLAEAFRGPSGPATGWGTLANTAIWATAVSALAAITLSRPIQGMPAWKTIVNLAGSVLGYGMLILGLVGVFAADTQHLAAYSPSRPPDPERLLARTLVNVGAITVILSCRPVARELVRRCLALRTGRVDRQTLLAIAAAIAVGIFGDALRWWAANAHGVPAEVLNVVGTVVIVVSSVLLTLGLAGAMIDAWRIARSLEVPSPSVRSVIGSPPPSPPR